MYNVLLETKGLSDELQSPNLDYLKAADLIESLIEELEEYRSEQKATDYFEKSFDIATKNHCNKEPSNLEDYVVLTSLGKPETISGPSDLRRAVLYPTVDVFLTELTRRYCEENMEIFRSLSALDPTSENFLDFEIILPLARQYNLNLEDVKMETRQAKRMMPWSGVGFETLEELFKYLKHLEMAFCELLKAARIAITLPVSTAGCERSFSKLKLIKNHLRKTMANARLKHLAVIGIHRKRALSIDLELDVDRFIQKFPNSRIVLK